VGRMVVRMSGDPESLGCCVAVKDVLVFEAMAGVDVVLTACCELLANPDAILVIPASFPTGRKDWLRSGEFCEATGGDEA